MKKPVCNIAAVVCQLTQKWYYLSFHLKGVFISSSFIVISFQGALLVVITSWILPVLK